MTEEEKLAQHIRTIAMIFCQVLIIGVALWAIWMATYRM